jgi:hypothetical protein
MRSRYAVLAVAGLVTPAVVAASELPVPVAELASAPFVSAAPAARVEVPAVIPTPVARLVWLDPAGVALGTEAVVRPEVARVLRAMGVAATWRRGEPHELARPGELRVIFLNRATQGEHRALVLGATPASFQGEPFVWIHVPSVRAAAGIASRSTGPSLDIHSARRLGIGLARVIAHEVVHALVPFLPHGKGLMAARLGRQMLTAAEIPVDPEVGLAVRAALLGAAPMARPEGDILASVSTQAVESTDKEPYR